MAVGTPAPAPTKIDPPSIQALHAAAIKWATGAPWAEIETDGVNARVLGTYIASKGFGSSEKSRSALLDEVARAEDELILAEVW